MGLDLLLWTVSSNTLIFAVIAVFGLLGLSGTIWTHTDPWWCCLREKKRFPQAGVPGVLVAQGWGVILLLYLCSLFLFSLGLGGRTEARCVRTKRLKPGCLQELGLPLYSPQCLWMGGERGKQAHRDNQVPRPNPCYSWVPLAGLACSSHLSVSPEKRGISGPARK